MNKKRVLTAITASIAAAVTTSCFDSTGAPVGPKACPSGQRLTFSLSQEAPLISSPGSEVVLAEVYDANRNGHLDLVFVLAHADGSANYYVALNDGQGRLSVPANTTNNALEDARDVRAESFGLNPTVVLVDVDGDALKDIVFEGPSKHLFFVAGDGRGGFGPARRLLDEPTVSYVLVDLNGDDLPDYVSGSGNRLRVRLTTGGGQFGPPVDVQIPIAGGNPVRLVAGDLDGDRHTDILWIEHLNLISFAVLSNGQGGFRTPVNGYQTTDEFALEAIKADRVDFGPLGHDLLFSNPGLNSEGFVLLSNNAKPGNIAFNYHEIDDAVADFDTGDANLSLSPDIVAVDRERSRFTLYANLFPTMDKTPAGIPIPAPEPALLPVFRRTVTSPVFVRLAKLNGDDLMDALIVTKSLGVQYATGKCIANQAPTATDQVQTVARGSRTVIPLSLRDRDGDALAVVSTATPDSGTLILQTRRPITDQRSVLYIADPSFLGTVTYTYAVSDGNLGSDTATLTIHVVEQTNAAPVASDQSVTLDEDTPTAIVLGASDADGDTLSYQVFESPSNGVLSGTAPNLSYTPNANFNGTDRFRFRANDGTVDSNEATVSITVTAINDAPVATAQSVTTAEDTAVAIVLGGTDAEGDGLSFAVVDAPGNGVLSGTAPDLLYTPNGNFNGDDSFTFRANDGSDDSAPATVSVSVSPVNDPPVAVVSASSSTPNQGDLVEVRCDASSDPEGPIADTFWAFIEGPEPINFNSSFSDTSDQPVDEVEIPFQDGTYVLRCTVFDEQGLEDSADLRLVVPII